MTRLVAAVAAGLGENVPHPTGWLGTTTQWAQGLGLAFAILDVVLIVLAWRKLRSDGETPAARSLVFFSLAILPVAVVFFGYSYGLPASERVTSCGWCHTMTPWVGDLKDLKSESLAALHYKNRYIQEDHCYTCHSDYGMTGTVRAKWEGLGHVIRFTLRDYKTPIKIAHSYSNLRCLACHGASQKYLANTDAHPAEIQSQLLHGEASCLDCHGPAHAPKDQARPKT